MKNKKIIGGVCSSVSKKYNFSAWVLRIPFVFISLFFPYILFIYLIIWGFVDYKNNTSGGYLLERLGIKYESYKDFWKLFLGILLIVVISLCPLWIGFLGAEIYTFITGNTCHEGNCFWMVLPWFLMMTVPFGLIVLLIFIVLSLIRLYKISKLNQ